MKLIIDIPEGLKQTIDNGFTSQVIVNKLWDATKNGTPLTESDDCVSREAVLDLFGGCVEEEFPKISYVVKMCINDLPSVQPKREKGEWIPIGYDGFADGNPVYDVWECSCCKEERYGDDESLPNFCPNCGADMRK